MRGWWCGPRQCRVAEAPCRGLGGKVVDALLEEEETRIDAHTLGPACSGLVLVGSLHLHFHQNHHLVYPANAMR